jgi:hypothetical protein
MIPTINLSPCAFTSCVLTLLVLFFDMSGMIRA